MQEMLQLVQRALSMCAARKCHCDMVNIPMLGAAIASAFASRVCVCRTAVPISTLVIVFFPALTLPSE